MRLVRRGVIKAVVLLVSGILTCAPPAQAGPAAALACAGSHAPEAQLPRGWRIYSSPETGFSIGYPAGWVLIEPGDDLVLPDAVVTFMPAGDCTVDVSGMGTNLIDVSVSVAVRKSPWAARSDADSQSAMVFTRTRFCEGAAGNRYETIVYSAVVHGGSYSVALFIHSGNPGCYTPGSIVLFDRAPLLEFFDRMVGTLSIWPPAM